MAEEYAYDAAGLRTKKTSYEGGTTATRYVYLGHSVLYETADGQAARYVLANGREIAKVAAKNLVTRNQASVETGLNGLGSHNGSGVRDTAMAWHGTASQKVTCTTAGVFGAFAFGTPVVAAMTYTAQAHARGSAARSAYITIEWKDAAGAPVAWSSSTFSALTTGEWKLYSVTATAPANSAKATVSMYVGGSGPIGDIIWADGFELAMQPSATEWQYPETYYTHRDHLGSSSVVTGSTGAVVCWNANHPYGEDWPVSPPGTPDIDRHRFTGKETDKGTGLGYFGARYYDPEVGRFTSPDTYTCLPDDERILFWGVNPKKIQKIGFINPQEYNRYAYCLNNPLRYIDPDGHHTEKVYDPVENEDVTTSQKREVYDDDGNLVQWSIHTWNTKTHEYLGHSTFVPTLAPGATTPYVTVRVYDASGRQIAEGTGKGAQAALDFVAVRTRGLLLRAALKAGAVAFERFIFNATGGAIEYSVTWIAPGYLNTWRIGPLGILFMLIGVKEDVY